MPVPGTDARHRSWFGMGGIMTAPCLVHSSDNPSQRPGIRQEPCPNAVLELAVLKEAPVRKKAAQ